MIIENNIEESSEFLRIILETSPDFIGVLNKDATFLYVNKVVDGLNRSDILGKSLFDYVQKDEVDTLKKNVERALTENKKVTYEINGTGAGGTVAVYACALIPIVYGGERVLVSISADVTSQKALENELNSRITELQSLNQSMLGREVRMMELKDELKKLQGENHPAG